MTGGEMHFYRIVDDEIAVVDSCYKTPTFFTVGIYSESPGKCPICGQEFVLQISSNLVQVESGEEIERGLDEAAKVAEPLSEASVQRIMGKVKGHLGELPELSPTEKAMADELGPDYATRVMVASDWMKKGGWRKVPEDLQAELEAADKAGCRLLVFTDWYGAVSVTRLGVGVVHVEARMHPDAPALLRDIRAVCWFPKLPDSPGATFPRTNRPEEEQAGVLPLAPEDVQRLLAKAGCDELVPPFTD